MARKTNSPTTKDLQAENDAMRKELGDLKRQLANKQRPRVSAGAIWRRVGVVASVVIATVLLILGNVLFWGANTIADPQRFSAVINPLIKSTQVQQALSQNVTDSLFERVDVQQLLAENLPERVAFAAPAIATQVENATQRALMNAMQADSFQQTWNSAIETIHTRLIEFIKNYEGDGVLQLSDIYDKLVARLSDTKLSFLSQVSLPEHVGSVTLVNAPWLPTAHTILNNIDLYRWLTIVLWVGFVALAIWLSRRRRRTAVVVGIAFAACMVLTLVAVRITGQYIVGSFSGQNQAAIQVVSDSLLDPLILQTRVLFVVSLLIAFVAWIGSPSKRATALRSRIQVLFGGNLHGALFGGRENRLTRWVGRHKRLLEWLFVALAAFVIVTSPLNMTTLLVVAVLLVLAILLIELLAAQPVQVRSPLPKK